MPATIEADNINSDAGSGTAVMVDVMLSIPNADAVVEPGKTVMAGKIPNVLVSAMPIKYAKDGVAVPPVNAISFPFSGSITAEVAPAPTPTRIPISPDPN